MSKLSIIIQIAILSLNYQQNVNRAGNGNDNNNNNGNGNNNNNGNGNNNNNGNGNNNNNGNGNNKNNGNGNNNNNGNGNNNNNGNGNGPNNDEIKTKNELRKAAKQAKLDEIQTCLDSGKTKKECIQEQKESMLNSNQERKAKQQVIDYNFELYKSCMQSCTEINVDDCIPGCLTESDMDLKSLGKLKMKMEKEENKAALDSCVNEGTSIKECIKSQLTNSSNKKEIITAVKDLVYNYIEAAIELSEGDPELVKSGILQELKVYAETEMGIKRVDMKFLIKIIKEIACQKYMVVNIDAPEDVSTQQQDDLLMFFGLKRNPTDFALCIVKSFIQIRDEYCFVEQTTDEDKNTCISDTKESLGITPSPSTPALDPSKSACWDVKIDTTTPVDSQALQISERYSSKPDCELKSSTDIAHTIYKCCLVSEDEVELAENEFEVSGMRDGEMIGSIEDEDAGSRRLQKVDIDERQRDLNVINYETGQVIQDTPKGVKEGSVFIQFVVGIIIVLVIILFVGFGYQFQSGKKDVKEITAREVNQNI